MLKSAYNKEHEQLFVYFRKLPMECSVCAKFQLHTTGRRKVNLGKREGNFTPTSRNPRK